MILEFTSLSEYLKELAAAPDLAVIGITDYAKEFVIGRAAVERQLARGTLEGVRINRSLYGKASSAQAKIAARDEQIQKAETVIINAAKSQRNIAYSEVMSHLGLNYKMSNDRNRMGVILGLLSALYYDEWEVVISSIVVKKGTDVPSDGFYGFLKSHGIEVDDEDTLHEEAQKRVWRFFKNK